MMSGAAQSLFAALFPSECRICNAPLANLSRLPVCTECLGRIVPVPDTQCGVCAAVLPPGYPFGPEGAVCGQCRADLPSFDRAVCFGPYSDTLRELIHLLKYRHVRPAANLLGRYVARAARALPFGGRVMVVPVPLHKSKWRERTFNQAELIAWAAMRDLGAQCATAFQVRADVLVRRHATVSQVGMSREQRKNNLRGAFAVSGHAGVRGAEILLVDDVLTTGATVSECARVLRIAGADKIWVATAARAVQDSVAAASYSQADSGEGTSPEWNTSEQVGGVPVQAGARGTSI